MPRNCKYKERNGGNSSLWLKPRVPLPPNWDGEPFTVDVEMEHLLRRKRIWTHQGMLLVEVYGSFTQGGKGNRGETTPVTMPLARFILETYWMMPLPPSKAIRHIDGDKRNLLYSNLEMIKA